MRYLPSLAVPVIAAAILAGCASTGPDPARYAKMSCADIAEQRDQAADRADRATWFGWGKVAIAAGAAAAFFIFPPAAVAPYAVGAAGGTALIPSAPGPARTEAAMLDMAALVKSCRGYEIDRPMHVSAGVPTS